MEHLIDVLLDMLPGNATGKQGGRRRVGAWMCGVSGGALRRSIKERAGGLWRSGGAGGPGVPHAALGAMNGGWPKGLRGGLVEGLGGGMVPTGSDCPGPNRSGVPCL